MGICCCRRPFILFDLGHIKKRKRYHESGTLSDAIAFGVYGSAMLFNQCFRDRKAKTEAYTFSLPGAYLRELFEDIWQSFRADAFSRILDHHLRVSVRSGHVNEYFSARRCEFDRV